MNDDTILEIEDLYINFYTKAGVVKAIDGVNLYIRKGETFGLVGESGCGKSVTANSIMGLVPTPPGKIENGIIRFSTPDEVLRKLKTRLYSKKAGTRRGKVGNGVRRGRKALPFGKKAGGEGNKAPTEVIQGDKIDILRLGKKDIRFIRGRAISMIFQEPMTALNPVFTAGDQISEIILLHEKKELAEIVLRNLKEARHKRTKQKNLKKKWSENGEFICLKCNAPIQENDAVCPHCGEDLTDSESGSMDGLSYGYYKWAYGRMAKDPDDIVLKTLANLPILKRYQRPMIREARKKALRMLRLVRIPDPQNVLKSFPYELSGGMQQRVMIAMALSCKPQLLIADEPTTALDVTIQAQILKLIQDLQDELGTSVLMITHNLGIVAEVCDRVGVMYAGCLVEQAETAVIFKEPLHPYTQGLMNSIPKVNLEVERLETIVGNVPNLITPPTGCRFHTRCPFVMEHCKREKPAMVEISSNHSVACHLYGGIS